MAISPRLKYPAQIDTSDLVGYPEGKARNIVVTGDGTGTPWEKEIVNDLLGFEQDLLDRAGLSPSGTPDKVGTSQYTLGVTAVATDAAVVVVAPTEALVRSDLAASRGVFAGAVQAQSQWAATEPSWQLDSTAGAAQDVMKAAVGAGVLSWNFSAGSNLPFKCTVSAVRCWVKQGSAWALGSRMKMRISTRDSVSFDSTVIDTVDAGAGTAVQSIVKSGLSIPLVATDTGVFPGGTPLDMTVALFAGVTGAPPPDDLAYFCEVRLALEIL